VIKSRADARSAFTELGGRPAHYFILTILAIRRCAEDPDVLPDWGEQARAAEGLAEFLTRFGKQQRRMPEVAEKFPELPEALRGVAQLLREYEARQKDSWLARDTRKKRTRPLFLFMRLASNDLKSMCGTYLDNQVAVLTDIAFGGETTADMVRAARRLA
jgi:hypothetical protein